MLTLRPVNNKSSVMKYDFNKKIYNSPVSQIVEICSDQLCIMTASKVSNEIYEDPVGYEDWI